MSPWPVRLITPFLMEHVSKIGENDHPDSAPQLTPKVVKLCALGAGSSEVLAGATFNISVCDRPLLRNSVELRTLSSFKWTSSPTHRSNEDLQGAPASAPAVTPDTLPLSNPSFCFLFLPPEREEHAALTPACSTPLNRHAGTGIHRQTKEKRTPQSATKISVRLFPDGVCTCSSPVFEHRRSSLFSDLS